MINSILMLLSSYIKNKKIAIIISALWIVYMASNANFSLGYTFPAINLIAFISVIFAVRKISNTKINMFASVISVLVWSMLIDTICYFMYPALTFGQNIVKYVGNGILFNIRYIFANVIVLCMVKLAECGIAKIKESKEEKIFE